MPVRLPKPPRLSVFSRYLLLGLALPCIYLGGASAAFFLRQRAADAAHDPARLVILNPPASTTRLMVFAPHCDDEALGNAGLIQQTIKNGGVVETVLFTNGDGFSLAAERYVRTLRVKPADYIRFATRRQQESVQAMTTLGMPEKSVLFLSYPDRGLMNLWLTNWTPDALFTSAFTRCDRSPYPVTFDSSSRYCGRDVLADVKKALRQFKPTLVTVTHPSDDHSDHAAASAFVTLAVLQLKNDPADSHWAKYIQLKYYLVHRGDWPTPQGNHLREDLVPPGTMNYLDTRWQSLPLKPEETLRKGRSLEQYGTQTAVMRRFLESFIRKSEIFGELPATPLIQVPDRSIRVDANPKDWQSLPPALLDPVRDNVLRDLQGGGDIRAAYLCRDSANLYLRLDTRQPVSSRLGYVLRLRAFHNNGDTSPQVITIQLSPSRSAQQNAEGIRVTSRNRLLEASIPLQMLQATGKDSSLSLLAFSIDTDIASVEVDKTGIRFLTCSERN